MAIYDLRILLETVGGKKTSYYSSGSSYAGGSGSFVDTEFDGLVLSSSQAYDRITGSVSCSFINDEIFTGEINSVSTFVQNNVLSSSLSGNQSTGSIVFTAKTDEYDRLLRYKFIGDKVCTVLGLPSNQWVYVDQFRLPADDESNIIQGNMNIGNAFVSDTITFANNANVNSDIPFYIDTGSDRYIKFIDTRDEGKVSLIFGYDKDTDTYEINASTGSIFNIKNLNELDVDRINAAQVNMVTSSTETSLATSFTNMVITGSLLVSGSETEEPLLRIRGNISSSGDIITTGDVIAKNYIVSSSITQITTSFSEGNTIFGDSLDDVHQFTGSLRINGNIGDNISGSIISTGSFGKVEGSGSAKESFLQQDINTTLNSDVGAISTGTTISAGTSIESILRQILIDFIPPTFTAFSIPTLDSNIEVGDTEQSTINGDIGQFTTGSSASDGSGFENNGGSFQLSMAGNATGDGNISATYAGNGSGTSDVILSSAITVKRTSIGSVVFTLTGTDSNGNVTTQTDTARFFFPIFYGGSSNTGASLNDSVLSSIIGDISSSVTTTAGTTNIQVTTTTPNESGRGKQTLINDTTSGTNLPTNLKIKLPASVQDSNNFTYIIYPNSYGDLTQVLKNDVQDETSTFLKLGTADHERYSSVDTTYVVYRSSGKQAFDEDDTLTLND
tara:strand:- start:1816 stop:3837 length:2022 start_codon:yes stop_codon:yes gene_type:complete